MEQSFGRTCISYSGYHLFPLQRAGWEKTLLHNCQSRYMASSCGCLDLLIIFSCRDWSLCMATTHCWQLHWVERSKRSCRWSAIQWRSCLHSSALSSLLPFMYLSPVYGLSPTDASRRSSIDNTFILRCNKLVLDAAAAVC